MKKCLWDENGRHMKSTVQSICKLLPLQVQLSLHLGTRVLIDSCLYIEIRVYTHTQYDMFISIIILESTN